MQHFRSSLVAVSIGSLLLGAQLVACGSDDEGTPSNAVPDAGPASTGPVLTVSESRGKIYLGQTAKIDGASVAPNITSNVNWVVLAAPSESAIKTESLEGANTASPTLKPDVLGTYTLQVSGDKDGVSSSVVVLIEAIDAPVFWRQVVANGITGGGVPSATASTHVSGAYGSQSKSVDCPTPLLNDAGGASTIFAALGARTASWGDSWEAQPGSPSRVAIPSFAVSGSSGAVITSSLLVATSQSSCTSGDAKAVVSIEGDAGPLSALIWNARFSPDGNRIAFMRDSGGAGRMMTVGFDGTGLRELAPSQTGPDGGMLNPDAGTFPRPGGPMLLGPVTARWKDNTHVGWITFFGPGAGGTSPDDWELYVVEDKDGAQPELAMRCMNVSPQTFDFLPDGSIVVAAQHEVAADGGTAKPMDLLVYRANANKDCELVRNLTNGKSDRDIARDLALSPDKTQVAFFWGTGSGIGYQSDDFLTLSTVRVDGSSPPATVPGTTSTASAGVGPRWVAGGTALTWGQQDVIPGGGPVMNGVGKQVAIPASGGTMRILAEGSQSRNSDGGVELRLVSGVGQGCSVTRGAVSGTFMVGGVAIGLASLIARRRRRSS